MSIFLELPFPPSVEVYYAWVNDNGRRVRRISKVGRHYRRLVEEVFNEGTQPPFIPGTKLSISIEVSEPDKRYRLIENIPVVVYHALDHAGVIDSIGDIDISFVRRMQGTESGYTKVEIREAVTDHLVDKP